jgi:hypothetical protein
MVTALHFWPSDVRWFDRRPYFVITSFVVVVDTSQLLGMLLRVGTWVWFKHRRNVFDHFPASK